MSCAMVMRRPLGVEASGCGDPSLLLDDDDRLLGAVSDREAGVLHLVGRDFAAVYFVGVAVVIQLEEQRRHDEAAVVALALLFLDADLHGNTTASCRGPRTWPPAHVTADGSTSR